MAGFSGAEQYHDQLEDLLSYPENEQIPTHSSYPDYGAYPDPDEEPRFPYFHGHRGFRDTFSHPAGRDVQRPGPTSHPDHWPDQEWHFKTDPENPYNEPYLPHAINPELLNLVPAQNETYSRGYAGDNLLLHGESSTHLGPRTNPPTAQQNLEVKPEPAFQLYDSHQHGTYAAGLSPLDPTWFDWHNVDTSIHGSQRQRVQHHHVFDSSQPLASESNYQTHSLTAASPHPSAKPIQDSVSPYLTISRHATHEIPKRLHASSAGRPADTSSSSVLNVASDSPRPPRSFATDILQRPSSSSPSRARVIEPSDADTRNTRRPAVKLDSTEKGKTVHRPAHGKRKRLSVLEVDPGDLYKERIPKPQPWGDFTYTDNGQIVQYPLTCADIREYVHKKRPTIWVQNHPAQCGERMTVYTGKCKWDNCPAGRRGTILAGWHRVAFDENEKLTTGGRMDPFNVAMVMHLWCFEQCFDPMEFYDNGSLKPDTRALPKEARNPMALERQHTADIIEEAYSLWFEKHKQEYRINGAIRMPRRHEDSLCCALVDYHLEKESDARAKSRIGRNKNVKVEHQKTIDRHRGNLKLFMDISREARQYNEAQGLQKNGAARKRRSVASGVSKEVHQDESRGHSDSRRANDLALLKPTICETESQSRSDSETRRSRGAVDSREYFNPLGLRDAHGAEGEDPNIAADRRAPENSNPSSTKRKRGDSAEGSQPRKIQRGKNGSHVKVGT